MEEKRRVASIFVGILGLVSIGVGLTFELMSSNTQARLFKFKCTSDLCVAYGCEYFRSLAFFMVTAAIVSLILALIIISIAADCGCGRKTHSSSDSRRVGICAFVFSWLTSVTAIILFLCAGATQYGIRISMNQGSLSFDDGSRRYDPDIRTCFKVKQGVFGAAAALTFAGITLGIISYRRVMSEESSPSSSSSSSSSSIANH